MQFVNLDRKALYKSNFSIAASGNVINIVGSKGLHFGNKLTYYLGPTTMPSNQQQETKDPENLKVKKCSLITLLMEAKITVRTQITSMSVVSHNEPSWMTRDQLPRPSRLPGH